MYWKTKPKNTSILWFIFTDIVDTLVINVGSGSNVNAREESVDSFGSLNHKEKEYFPQGKHIFDIFQKASSF